MLLTHPAVLLSLIGRSFAEVALAVYDVVGGIRRGERQG